MADEPNGNHVKFMLRALRLAARGMGTTHPNPMVGAVLVRGGRIVGEGWHRRAGEPHAEVIAISRAGELARGATLYVTLEPCSHHGRTGPCTEAIIKSGIGRVVAACRDPNPLVNGRGLEVLAEGGVQVLTGVCEERAREVNRAFFHFIVTGKPFVTLKMASSLDGRIATAGGESRWITGEAARKMVHRLRGQVDAVLVGVGTVLADDPQLTARGPRTRRQPLRLVLDPGLRTPLDSRIIEGGAGAGTVLFAGRGVPAARIRPYRDAGVRVLQLPLTDGWFSWDDLSSELLRLGVIHLLVEGGGRTAARFLDQGAVCRLDMFLAPLFLGGQGVPSVSDMKVNSLGEARRFRLLSCTRVGTDLHLLADLG